MKVSGEVVGVVLALALAAGFLSKRPMKEGGHSPDGSACLFSRITSSAFLHRSFEDLQSLLTKGGKKKERGGGRSFLLYHFKQKNSIQQAGWYTSTIPATRRWRQEDH